MAWTQTANIKGASGVPGASGASGSPGASGIPGASGASGASGAAGTTTWSGITDKPAVIAAGVDAAAARNVISAEYTGNKGAANGYASLDSSGLVPSSQLPSFVDDVVEAANLAAFPATGESGKIYTALDTNKVYRWGGSSYTEISPSPGSTDAVPEGSTNLYYTAARADGRITAAVGSTVQAYSATLTTYSGKTAPTGAVVGTTDSQTLTNKDLSGSSNTFPAFIKRSVSTITSDTTIGTATNTDYVVLCGASSSDSNWSSVVSLLNFNGSNNSTTITDSAGTPLTWTASGNAKLTTSNPKFGTASLSCDGTNSFISTGSVSAFDPSVNFTAEFWMRPANTNSGNNGIISAGVNASWNPFALLQDGQTVKWLVGNAAGTGWDIVFGASGNVLTANTWHHVAIVNSSSAFTVYVNGTSALSTTRKSWSSQNREMYIGKNYDGHFNGQIDDFRYTKSVARYTSNFTAPTLEFSQNVAAVPTLPSASSAGTNTYTIKNTTSASLTIGVTSSQQIDGATGGLALPAGQAARLIADGASGWRTI